MRNPSGFAIRKIRGLLVAGVRRVGLVSIDGVPLDAVLHSARGQGRRGVVIQVHGINADMDEGGMFIRLADRLAEADFGVLRFSFRGHGGSGGTQRGVTIAGEMLDLQAAFEHVADSFSGSLSVVAASFGAVSTLLSLPRLGDRLGRLVLWNPVLDLRRTFISPELPWGRENFNVQRQKLLLSQGFVVMDGEFEVGWVLFEEFSHYRPLDCFLASGMPALVIHGDRDSYVSYDIARTAALAREHSAFHSVAGSDHGFDSRAREDEAIEVTVGWLVGGHPGLA